MNELWFKGWGLIRGDTDAGEQELSAPCDQGGAGPKWSRSFPWLVAASHHALGYLTKSRARRRLWLIQALQ